MQENENNMQEQEIDMNQLMKVRREKLDKLKQAARLEAYASYSEFVRRTALIEADKVIAEKRLDNKMED